MAATVWVGDPSLMEHFEATGHLVLQCDAALTGAIADAIRYAAEFFHLPAVEKKRSFSEQLFEGYRDIGIEYSKVPERPDLSESFSVRLMNERRAREFLRESAMPLYTSMIRVIGSLNPIVDGLIAAMVRYFSDQPSSYPRIRCDFGSHLQLNCYRPSQHHRDLLQDPHEDALLVTLTYATGPGLELNLSGDTYEPSTVRPGELVVMPGEILSLLCGYRIKPLYHQVRNHPELALRFSMMYFVNPEPGQKLEAWVQNETNQAVDIMERAVTNPMRFGLPPLPLSVGFDS